MKILIIDRDMLATQLLQSRLVQDGHEVVVEPIRKTAIDMISHINFDVILIDPAPLPSVRQVTLPLRWEQGAHYFYIMQISHNPDPDEVTQAGLNDMIAKPFDWQEVTQKMHNAQRLVSLMRHLCTTPEIHSDGVLFGKRPFYQLMLSVLDRCYRYNERAFLMRIRISNIDEMRAHLSAQEIEEMKRKTEQFLSSMHRRSDFLGHLDNTDYALLILRPTLSSEPLDAVDRFGIALRDYQNTMAKNQRPAFTIQLWGLPSAVLMKEYHLGDEE